MSGTLYEINYYIKIIIKFTSSSKILFFIKFIFLEYFSEKKK